MFSRSVLFMPATQSKYIHKIPELKPDMVTLDLYKADSWNKPAKGIRFNLRNDADKLKIIMQKDSAYAGGYLYK